MILRRKSKGSLIIVDEKRYFKTRLNFNYCAVVMSINKKDKVENNNKTRGRFICFI